MTRETVRALKSGARAGSRPGAEEVDHMFSAECALALLARSIQFAHGRLAVQRLSMAVDARASIPREHWLYCARVARESRDSRVQELYREAAFKSSQMH